MLANWAVLGRLTLIAALGLAAPALAAGAALAMLDGLSPGSWELRDRSGRVIQIESQGIADGVPFEILAEGRRTGAC